MEYDTCEAISQLADVDQEFQELIKHVNPMQPPSESRVAALAELPQGETLDIPMRDGYISQIRIHRPVNVSAKPGPLVVLLFGGGFIKGDNTDVNPFSRAINIVYGYTVVNLSYRLAPEHKWPAAPNDTWDSLKWLAANQQSLNVDLGAGFIVGGFSAGANLAAVAGQMWLDELVSPPITGLLLMVPCLLQAEIVPQKYKDLWFSTEQNANAPFFNDTFIKATLAAYAPDITSQKFSPFNSKTPHVGLPPVYIAACGLDPLRDDALVYHKTLLENSVKTKLDVYPGVPHGHIMIPTLKASRKCAREFVQAVGWVRGDEVADDKDVDDALLTGGFFAGFT